MDPFVKVAIPSLVHCAAEAGADDVLVAVSSAGAHATAAAKPMTASMGTTLESLRMGGIIAHLMTARHLSDHDDRRNVGIGSRVGAMYLL
jgi:hypothetical protein